MTITAVAPIADAAGPIGILTASRIDMSFFSLYRDAMLRRYDGPLHQELRVSSYQLTEQSLTISLERLINYDDGSVRWLDWESPISINLDALRVDSWTADLLYGHTTTEDMHEATLAEYMFDYVRFLPLVFSVVRKHKEELAKEMRAGMGIHAIWLLQELEGKINHDALYRLSWALQNSWREFQQQSPSEDA